MGPLFVALVALMPASAMLLIGFLSTASVRKSVVLFALCGLWTVLGVILWFGDWFYGLLSIAQAVAGMGGWIGSVLSRMAQPVGADPSAGAPGTSAASTPP